MAFQRPDDGSTPVATLGIETTRYDTERGDLVVSYGDLGVPFDPVHGGGHGSF
jgi:hypothetical protein